MSSVPTNQNYEPLDLSSKVEYALLALLALANHPDPRHPLTISGIHARHGIPERYLEQILTILRRGGIVHSQRGARGGYALTREPQQISLLEVIALMDGTRKPREHTLMATPEREVLHQIWQKANVISQTFLQNCTLQDLCQQLEAHQQKAPMYYI
ncbi:MAG: Rrf2 family transcriptional regulator [Leptolyngbya sp. BL-A-14]